jgi:uncharacterized protein YciU (UPF0263 family)
MKSNSLSLEGYPCELGVEADTWDRSVEFSIEGESSKSVELPISELEKLRDFINEFLAKCEENEKLMGNHS